MVKVSTRVLFLSTIIFANYWIWRILKEDFLLGVALVLLSFTLFFLSNIKFNRKTAILGLFLIAFIVSSILINGFDRDLIVLSRDQQKTIGTRHGYFSVELGKLFQNKFALHFYKDINPYANIYERNLFNNLSPNLYFFSNHPREREKIEEFAMYPSILVIPFLIGLLQLIKFSNRTITIYFIFAILMSGFIRQNYFSGPILFFPLINILIISGLIRIYQVFKK